MQRLFLRGEFGVAGQIIPFVGIVPVIVKFFFAVAVSDVAPVFCAVGIVLLQHVGFIEVFQDFDMP